MVGSISELFLILQQGHVLDDMTTSVALCYSHTSDWIVQKDATLSSKFK